MSPHDAPVCVGGRLYYLRPKPRSRLLLVVGMALVLFIPPCRRTVHVQWDAADVCDLGLDAVRDWCAGDPVCLDRALEAFRMRCLAGEKK